MSIESGPQERSFTPEQAVRFEEITKQVCAEAEKEIRELYANRPFHNWEHTERVRDTALALFDTLAPYFKMDEGKRRTLRAATGLAATTHDWVMDFTYNDGKVTRTRGWVDTKGNERRSFEKTIAALNDPEFSGIPVEGRDHFNSIIAKAHAATYPDFVAGAAVRREVAERLNVATNGSITKHYDEHEGALRVSQPFLEEAFNEAPDLEQLPALVVAIADIMSYGHQHDFEALTREGFAEKLESDISFTERLLRYDELERQEKEQVLSTLSEWVRRQVGFGMHQDERLELIVSEHPLLSGQAGDALLNFCGQFPHNLDKTMELADELQRLRNDSEALDRDRLLELICFEDRANSLAAYIAEVRDSVEK